jgi:hypothetical protein
MGAIADFLNRYAGTDTVASELTAKAQEGMLKLYEDAWLRICKALDAARKDSLSFATYSHQTQLLKQVGQLIDDMKGGLTDYLAKAMSEAAKTATSGAVKDMHLVGDKLANPASWHFKFNQDWVEMAFRDSYDHIAAQTDKMKADFKALLRQEATEVFRKAAVEGISRRQATQELRDKLLSKEPTFQFVDKAGRAWDLRDYLGMLTTTVMHNTMNECYVNTMTNEGKDLVAISAHGATDRCGPWEGQVISLTGATTGYPTLGEVRGSGDIFHPRCKHRLVAYTPKITEIFKRVAAGESDEEILEAIK